MVYLIQLLFYLLPIAAIVFFIKSLVNYISARKEYRYQTGNISEEELKKRKLLLIVSSAIMVVLVAVVVGFAILLIMAIAYM